MQGNIPMAIIKMGHRVLNALFFAFTILWCERRCSGHLLLDLVILR